VIERRAEAKRKSEEGLIELVLKDAPLAELNSAAAAIDRYYRQSLQPPPRPQPFGQIRDYRSLLGPAQPAPVNDPRRPSPKWSLGPYLAWRKAVEERSGEVQRLQVELMKSLASLPPDVSAHIQRQIARTTRPKTVDREKEPAPAETETAASDMEALIAELQSAKEEMRNVLMASSLPELVQKLKRGPRSELASETSDFSWGALAASSRRDKAFRLRERIARSRIKGLNISENADSVDTPLIVVYREALEKAVDSGQIPAAEAALAQSQLLSILPAEEAMEWVRLLGALKPSNTSSRQRRDSLRLIISNSSYPAIMRAAALQLKKT
jgi:hypothetical protein